MGRKPFTMPICRRSFCNGSGKAPETVEEYIARQSPEAQVQLTELQSLLRCWIPGVTEKIAWSMPQYKKNGHDLSFAAFKKHISFYADAETLERFQPQLSGFVIRKNALYLPYDRPLPREALKSLVQEVFAEECI